MRFSVRILCLLYLLVFICTLLYIVYSCTYLYAFACVLTYFCSFCNILRYNILEHAFLMNSRNFANAKALPKIFNCLLGLSLVWPAEEEKQAKLLRHEYRLAKHLFTQRRCTSFSEVLRPLLRGSRNI